MSAGTTPRRHRLDPRWSERARKLCAAFLALLFLVLPLRKALAAEVPIPKAPEHWVTDNAALLSRGARAELDGLLRDYERQSGHQVVVWVGTTIGDTPLEDFAVRTFEAWKLGQAGKDDGVLLLVLAEDRKVAIEVGYGLEDKVPDATASRIIREVLTPRLQAGDADGALRAGVAALLGSIEGKPFESRAGPTKEKGSERGGGPSGLELVLYGVLALGFLLLLITNPSLALHLLIVLASSGRGGGGGGGGGFGGGGGRSGGGGARGSW